MPVGATPIIRLEVDGMKDAICVSLSEYAAKMDADIQRAVEQMCRPEVLVDVIQSAAAKAINEAVRQEIDSFFRYGGGRRAIKDAVERQLEC